MTIGGLNHKLEWCVRGPVQHHRRFPGSVDLQDNGHPRRRNAWDQNATAVSIPVAVIHRPFIQRNGLILPGGSVLNGKKVDAMVMRKIGERSFCCQTSSLSLCSRSHPVSGAVAFFHFRALASNSEMKACS